MIKGESVRCLGIDQTVTSCGEHTWFCGNWKNVEGDGESNTRRLHLRQWTRRNIEKWRKERLDVFFLSRKEGLCIFFQKKQKADPSQNRFCKMNREDQQDNFWWKAEYLYKGKTFNIYVSRGGLSERLWKELLMILLKRTRHGCWTLRWIWTVFENDYGVVYSVVGHGRF